MRHLPRCPRIAKTVAFVGAVLLLAPISRVCADQDSESAGDAAAARDTDSPPFGIVIAPRRKLGAENRVALQEEAPAPQPADAQPAPEPQPPADGLPLIVPRPVRTPRYIEVYNSIPFIRAEYEANPSYRHEATMEILTGNPRPPKIYSNGPASTAPGGFAPLNPYNPPVLRQFFDFTRGPYSRYQHLFGYEGGYRPLFYLY